MMVVGKFHPGVGWVAEKNWLVNVGHQMEGFCMYR